MKSLKFKKRLKGSITILLIIILLPSILLSGIIVDTSRVNIGKATIDSAGDLALNSALANYDTLVKEVYGLFAMTQNMTEEERNEEIRKYFERTLVSYGVTDEASAGDYLNSLLGDFNNLIGGTPDGDIKTLLGMEIPKEDFKIVTPEASSLANPAVMRKQIVDYMKFRGPINFGLSIFDVVNSFSTIEAQADVVEKQVVAQESMQDVTDGCKDTIEEIRAYDKKLKEIQSGDKSVKGKFASGDELIVPVELYEKQVLRYRSDKDDTQEDYKWDCSYEHINRLLMCFLLKVPETKGMYLTKINVNNKSEYFVQDDGVHSGKSGISVNVSLASDKDSAQTQFNNQISKLSTSSTYYSNASKYTSYDFVSQSYVNMTDKVIYKATEDSAIESFTEYEKFMTDTDGAKVKYADIKAVFEELCILEKIYNNCHSKLQKVEDDAKKEMDNAEKPLNKAKEELEDIESDISDAEKDLAKAKTPAAIASANNRISDLKSKKSDKEDEIKGLQDTYDSKKSDYENAKALRENCEADYKSCTSNYMTLSDNYISDLNDYARYQEAAKNVVTDEVRKINGQFVKIVENLESLSYSLDTTALYLGEILVAVKQYDGNVEAWRNANNNYTSANGKDTFSAANAGEIESSVKKISDEQVEDLKKYVQSLAEEYETLYNFIIDDSTNNFKYGTKKVYSIASYNDAFNMAKAKKDALPAIVTKSDADTMFDSLYAKTETPNVFCDQGIILSLVDPDIVPLTFLMYLNSTYPPEESATDEQKQDKATYDQMMDNLESDNSGDSIADGDDYTGKYLDNGGENTTVDGNPLAYTYADKGDIGNENLPSSIFAASKKDASAKNLDINQNGDKIEASKSLADNKAGLSALVSGIKNIASTSLENIYIINYIFENFSYNTMMQDLIIKGEGVQSGDEVYPISATTKLKDASVVSKYKDKAVTLSNIPKNAYNNYLYGGEIEYIIYGNHNPKSNVTSAKATIYAIRCGFNMIFAFTDSEIRNTTRSIGVAVQAATMGVVPYQVVQVVLQLALAFAESAIDLTSLSNGLSVVLVKSKDTWNLSLSNATKMAGNYLADVASEYAQKAILTAGQALQNVVDSTADELIDSVNKLSEDLAAATKNEINKVVGQGFEYLENKLFLAMEEISLFDYNGVTATVKGVTDNTRVLSKEDAKKEIGAMIDKAIGEFTNGFKGELSGIPVADSVLISLIETGGKNVGEKFKAEVLQFIDSNYTIGPSGSNNVTTLICNKINEWQNKIVAMVEEEIKVREITSFIEEKVNTALAEARSNLNGYIGSYTNDLSEEAAASIKEKVTAYTNSFVDKYIPSSSSANLGNSLSGGKNSESLSSIIKLGYRDYLMLFAFIEICTPTGSDNVLTRIADVIQLNMQNASENSTFNHKKGSEFLMKNAYTYVGVESRIKLDMLFIDMDLFRRTFDDETGNFETTLSKYGVIEYSGLQGY